MGTYRLSASIALASAALLAAWVTGCTEHDTIPTAVSDVSPGGEASASGTSSYLLLADADELPAGLDRAVAAARGRLVHTVDGIGVAVAASTAPDFASRLEGLAGVRAAIPNPELALVPRPDHVANLGSEVFSDPPASGDDDFFFDLQWGHDAIDAPEAWNAGARGSGARVAILDSGIDPAHPDLAQNLNLTLSRSFRPGEAIDDPPAGAFHHGTHVAGIVAAADNGLGTIGVAPEAEIVALKVVSTGQEGFVGNFGDLIAAIVHAADVGADVINMSLGALVSRRGEILDAEGHLHRVPASAVNHLLAALDRATGYAHRRGATLVASAGNLGQDGDADRDFLFLPASARHVLSIAATGPRGWALDPDTDLDLPAFYSNSGQSAISFAAPGGNLDFALPPGQLCTVAGVTVPCFVFDFVMSTNFTTVDPWAWTIGTSMAAPHVAGVAALVVGQNGGSTSPSLVEEALRRSADDLGKPGQDDFFGAGRVNAGRAVR